MRLSSCVMVIFGNVRAKRFTVCDLCRCGVLIDKLSSVILHLCPSDILRSRDELIQQSLTEKQQIFAALYETVMEQETPHKGLLLRGDTADLQQGETLLMGAIDEGRS